MRSPQAQPAPFVIGDRYEVREPPIGKGGMGVVYRAYDIITRRYVALKTISGVGNPTALSLFEREWSVLARLSHPDIVDILETGQFEEYGQRKPFFVMPRANSPVHSLGHENQIDFGLWSPFCDRAELGATSQRPQP